MPSATLRSLRFAHAWTRGHPPLEEEVLDGGLLLIRRPGAAPRPSWIVLHGVTRPGRRHPELLRFARSLAATGASVLLPEIREWRELRLVSAPLVPVLEESLEAVEAHPGCRGPAAVAGFSFGCPQLLVAAGTPRLRGRITGILGYGGYADPGRVLRFLFTGRHRWKGDEERLAPDPYGRWVMGANFLTRVPEHRDAGPVAEALREMAFEAGDRRIPADDPTLEPYRSRLEAGLPEGDRDLFRLFAPPEGERPAREAGEAMADALAAALVEGESEADPRRWLDRVEAPIRLIHGRSDRLIPWSETRRLEASFPETADVRASITGLFAHSGGAGPVGVVESAAEGVGFLRALRGALALDGAGGG